MRKPTFQEMDVFLADLDYDEDDQLTKSIIDGLREILSTYVRLREVFISKRTKGVR